MKLDKRKFLDRLRGEVIEGELEAFSEQGTEGTHWAVFRHCEDVASPYDNLFILHNDDYLVVLEPDLEHVRWEGKIDLVWTDNWQWVEGYGTCHGIQAGMEATTWAKMFFDKLPAYMIRDKKNALG